MLPLDQVITTEQLHLRPRRAPDLEQENRVLLALAQAMVRSPQQALQQLVDEARALCRADSAGISLLEPAPGETDGACFRWIATAGGLGPFVGNTMPRHFSPCGSVVDKDAMMLMNDPVRHYQYISGLPLAVREVLLVPFHRDGSPIGTLWICAHDDHHFDGEDARVVSSLSQYASVVVQVISSTAAHMALQSEARRLAEARFADVTEQHRRLAASERDKTRFLATLTHELRNSLAPISNAAQVLKLAGEPRIQARAHEILARQIDQINRLVDDLLDVARLSSDKLRLDRESVELNEVVGLALEANRAHIERSGQAADLLLPMEPLRVRGDRIRLAQILTNLLTNAAKYGRAGGTVRVTLGREADFAVIAVTDEGMGIHADMLPRIFELFVQVEHSLERSEGGLGIGLALAKRLVEMHAGTIEVASEGEDRGTSFVVRLPLLAS